MDLSQQDDAAIDSKKGCSMCGAEKSPLWRSGPAGPKSLCNACGIKHRKRNMPMSKTEKKNASQSIVKLNGSSLPSTSTETSSKSKPKLETSRLLKCKLKLRKSSSTNLRQSVKEGLVAFGSDMVRLRSVKSQRSEEEEAAALLMSLSCGFIFA